MGAELKTASSLFVLQIHNKLIATLNVGVGLKCEATNLSMNRKQTACFNVHMPM